MVTSVFGANLGDTLWTTPLARYLPPGEQLIVEMRRGDAKAEATAPILDGVATVRWVDSPAETPKAQIGAHVTQQILAAAGFAGPSIPRVVLQPAEVLWAVDRLSVYDTRKLVAFVNQNSANADPGNHRAQYVRPPLAVMEALARFWKAAGYTVLQLGPAPSFYARDPFTSLPGAEVIRGLTVRQMAALYHVIGRMVSGDTGDYHLMLAVGGKVACLVPEHSDSMGYRHWDLLYDTACWGDERPRVHYALHEDWNAFTNTALFTTL